jgi:hypothetical protein
MARDKKTLLTLLKLCKDLIDEKIENKEQFLLKSCQEHLRSSFENFLNNFYCMYKAQIDLTFTMISDYKTLRGEDRREMGLCFESFYKFNILKYKTTKSELVDKPGMAKSSNIINWYLEYVNASKQEQTSLNEINNVLPQFINEFSKLENLHKLEEIINDLESSPAKDEDVIETKQLFKDSE